MTRKRTRLLAVACLLIPGIVILISGLLVPAGNLLLKSFTTNVGYLQTDSALSLQSYSDALTDDVIRQAAGNSFFLAAVSASVCLGLAYPAAFYLVFQAKPSRRNLLLFLIVLSSFLGYLVRVYAWRSILGRDGVVNTALDRLGLTDEPLLFLLFSKWAVLIGLVSVYLPFAILIVTVSMQNVRLELLETARDLGAGAVRAFVSVLMPLTATGAIMAWIFTFILSASDYIAPQLLGGDRYQALPVLVANQFLEQGDFPLGAALTVLLLVCFGLLFLVLSQLRRFRGLRMP